MSTSITIAAIVVGAAAIGVLAWYLRRHYRNALAVFFSAVLVVTTALVALVVEDVLPAGQGGIDLSGSTPVRISAAIAAVLLLGLLAWLLSRSRQVHGTLYHVRILSSRAPDLHSIAVARARARALSYRSVTRAPGLNGRSEADLTDTVAATRAELERAANTDDATTGFECAPNAHWPIAFTLGADWPLPDSTTLLELERDTPEPVLTASASPRTPLGSIPLEEVDPTARLVHIDIHFSDQRLITPDDRDRHLTSLFGIPADHTVLWGIAPGEDQPRHYSPPDDKREPLHIDNTLVATAAETTAIAILQALGRFPHAHIAVTTRIPKIVAVLAGRYFTAHLQSRLPARPRDVDATALEMKRWQALADRSTLWNDPWPRLILLNYDASTDNMQVLRVHPRQPVRAPRYQPVGPLSGTLINLTPHDLVVYNDDNTVLLTVPAHNDPARVTESRSPATTLTANEASVPVHQLGYLTTPDPLPPVRAGTWLVVSRIAAHLWTHRPDLLFPIDEVRDDHHRIIGCRGLARLTPPEPQP